MKSALRLNFLLLLVVLAKTCFAVDVSTKLGFESAYVTYGTKYSEETWVPMLDISQGDYYAGIWGYIPTHTQKSFEGEWDFFGGRTIKVNKLLSFDVGATVYRYPRTDVDNTTLEGFLWVNFDTTLSPKLKLYYDVIVNNWIGEVQVQHTFTLNKTTSLILEGHGGFPPEYHKAWYYATAKADLAFALNEKTKLFIGVRSTNNTDKAAVGHGVVNWYGASSVTRGEAPGSHVVDLDRKLALHWQSPVKLSSDWPDLSVPPALEPGEVHLWRVKVPGENDVPAHWAAQLTAEEQERVARKRIPMDGRRTLTSRACLRLLLGDYLNLPANEIGLSSTAGGKPIVVGPAPSERIEFNVSHSDEWVLLGFSRGLALGVDVERHREVEFDDLVKGFFSPEERAAWAAVPPGARAEAFFTTWTRKESYLKALGVGLAKSLDSFTVTVGASPTARLVWCADNPAAPQQWLITSIPLAAGYSAAMAIDSAAQCLRTFTLTATPRSASFASKSKLV